MTLEEIRRAIPAPELPPHLDAVCGSLVRTGHLEAFPARAWQRERRNAYRPVGTDYPVVEAVTLPSRPEIVMSTIRHLWGAEDRDGLPITSAEIRGALLAMNPAQPLVTGKTLLPTALNELRRPGVDGVPLIEAVRINGLRAQRWIPYGSGWSWREEGLKSATLADRLAMAVGEVLKRTGQVLVTAAEVAPHWTKMASADRPSPLPGFLAEISRPVPSAKGRRVARRLPAVIRIGEVRGEALYTIPAHMKRWRGCLAPAVADLRWRQWIEGWDERWLDRELDFVRSVAPTVPLYDVRLALLRRQVSIFHRLAERLDQRSPKRTLRNPHRMAALEQLDRAREVVGTFGRERIPSSWRQGPRWLTAAEANAWAIRTFRLGDDPPHVERGFLAKEVIRRRVPVLPQPGQAGTGAPVRWVYDPVTLWVACLERWGRPGEAIFARQGSALLGPIRALSVIEEDIEHRNWSSLERKVVLAVIGALCPEGAMS